MNSRAKARAAAYRNTLCLEKNAALVETGPEKFIVPELTVKDLLSVIPSHCFKRSVFRSFSYVAMDFGLIGTFYCTAKTYTGLQK